MYLPVFGCIVVYHSLKKNTTKMGTWTVLLSNVQFFDAQCVLLNIVLKCIKINVVIKVLILRLELVNHVFGVISTTERASCLLWV